MLSQWLTNQGNRQIWWMVTLDNQSNRGIGNCRPCFPSCLAARARTPVGNPLKCRTAARSRGYVHIWQFSASSKCSTKLAYEALFIGGTHFNPWERIWKSRAPSKCKFFMWTVAHKKCWTADRLARKGFHHLEVCPLCDQAEETFNHLLVSCVFTR